MSIEKREVLKLLGKERIYDRECMCGEGFGETVFFDDGELEEFPFEHERCSWCGDIVSDEITPDWDRYWAWKEMREAELFADNRATERLNNAIIRGRQ